MWGRWWCWYGRHFIKLTFEGDKSPLLDCPEGHTDENTNRSKQLDAIHVRSSAKRDGA